MGSATLVSLEEYLNTSYEPDMDYVDGELVRRNVGTPKHSRLQLRVGAFFLQYEQSHQIAAFVEGRLSVHPATGRYRVPDVMVVKEPFKAGKVIVDVPLIIIEIKSPDDTLDDVLDRCLDYDKLGVRYVLVMDPDRKRAFTFEQGAFRLLTSSTITLELGQGQDIDLPVAELFAGLGED